MMAWSSRSRCRLAVAALSLRRAVAADSSLAPTAARGSSPFLGRSMATTGTSSSSSSAAEQPPPAAAQDQVQLQQQQRRRPVYVHHISQTILRHLQDERHDWLVAHGLDRGLRLNANGTFVLQFPAPPPPPPTSSNNSTTTATNHFLGGVGDGGRIWTSYDSYNKQHWLSVYRRKLKARFLLKQDDCSTHHQSSMDDPASSTLYSEQQQHLIQTHIRSTVTEMIAMLDHRK